MEEVKLSGRLENLCVRDVCLQHAAAGEGLRGRFPAEQKLSAGQWYTGEEMQGEVYGSLNEVFDLVIPSLELLKAAETALENQLDRPLTVCLPIASHKRLVKTYYLVDLELAAWNHLYRSATQDMMLPVGAIKDENGQVCGFRWLVPTETLFARVEI